MTTPPLVANEPAGLANGARAAAEILARLLALISEVAPASKTLGTTAFREEIDTYRTGLTASVKTPGQVLGVASQAVDACERFFGRAEVYQAERESEVRALIQMLHDALATLGGQSSSYHEQLLASGEQLARLSELDDIRTLKQRLGKQVLVLTQTVQERQREEKRHFDELLEQVGTLEGKLARTKRQAETDGLTGIANRASFDRIFAEWLRQHESRKSRFVLAMIDLDDFKKTNDQHGHQVGDRVLVCTAKTLTDGLGPADVVARYGGEEFVALLETTRLKKARKQMAELTTRIAETRYTYKQAGQQRSIDFTVSIGLAEYSVGEPGDELIRRADEALYDAKRRGKNRVEVRKTGLFGR